MLASNFYQNRDIYFKKVALLLTHLGDRSISRKALTLVGNPEVSTQVTKFGKGSWFFNGNICTIRTIPLGLANRSFSIEFWILKTTPAPAAGEVILTTYNNNGAQVGTLIVAWANNNSIGALNPFGVGVSSSPLLLNQWHLVRIVYTHSPVRGVSLFVNNVLQGTSAISITAQANNFHIGGSQGDSNIGTRWFKGYLESLRVTLDISRSEIVPKKPFPYS